MKLTTWLKRRQKLKDEYTRLQLQGDHLVFLADKGEATGSDLAAHVRKLDVAYLAICALDKVETE
jgi:hypothetical protein